MATFSNAASRRRGTIETKRANPDGSQSTIVEPYRKPTGWQQSPRNSLSSLASNPTDGTTSNEQWASIFGTNSPSSVRRFGATGKPSAPSTEFGAGDNPMSGGFGFIAPPNIPASLPSATPANRLASAVSRGEAAHASLGLPLPSPNRPAGTFGSTNASTVSAIPGGPQYGDTILSKYGSGKVTLPATNASAYASRLKKLTMPDYSDLGIYG